MANLDEGVKRSLNRAIESALGLRKVPFAKCLEHIDLSGVPLELVPKLHGALIKVPPAAIRESDLERIVYHDFVRDIEIRHIPCRLLGEYRECTIHIYKGDHSWLRDVRHEYGHSLQRAVREDFKAYHEAIGRPPGNKYGSRDETERLNEAIADGFEFYLAGVRIFEGAAFFIERYGTL